MYFNHDNLSIDKEFFLNIKTKHINYLIVFFYVNPLGLTHASLSKEYNFYCHYTT